MTAAGETLRLGPRERVTVRVHSPELLEVEAAYEPTDSPPPKHFHPAQDEHFEVVEGTLTARVGDSERELHSGDTLDVPRRTVHQMWNAGPEPLRMIWQTTPALRTLEWFRAIDELGRTGSRPNLVALAPLLREYRDVFRPAGPGPVLQAAFAVLAPIGRLRR